jgi:hypothetical protein
MPMVASPADASSGLVSPERHGRLVGEVDDLHLRVGRPIPDPQVAPTHASRVGQDSDSLWATVRIGNERVDVVGAGQFMRHAEFVDRASRIARSPRRVRRSRACLR